MFAIEINSKNLETIIKEVPMMESERSYVRDLALREKKWHFVRNYTTSDGKQFGWTTLPPFVIPKLFEYDPIKIQSDWDQIVRKEKK